MKKGTLFLVATPIGNLKDITFRAIEVLKGVNCILCEDTRRAEILFQKYRITTRKESFYDFNKKIKTPKIIQMLKEGKNFALISDAGTPGISDPGFYLVRSAVKEGINVISIPGPSALISALVVSGLPTDRFVFEGFLPRKEGKRKKRLAELKAEKRTIILFESPQRIKKTLTEILNCFGQRNICLAREITKIYEETARGFIPEILAKIEKSEIPLKGEFVLIIQGLPE